MLWKRWLYVLCGRVFSRYSDGRARRLCDTMRAFLHFPLLVPRGMCLRKFYQHVREDVKSHTNQLKMVESPPISFSDSLSFRVRFLPITPISASEGIVCRDWGGDSSGGELGRGKAH